MPALLIICTSNPGLNRCDCNLTVRQAGNIDNRVDQRLNGFSHGVVAYIYLATQAACPVCCTPQEVPPGLHMIFLPFADDIREPECDPAIIGDGVKARA